MLSNVSTLALPLTLSAAVLIGIALFLQVRSPRNPFPFPPGPKGEFIWGNARQMPSEAQWLTFSAWRKQYGGYVFLRIFWTPFLVINSAKAANDLLEKRSVIYSDRPVSIMATDLIGWDFNMTLIGCCDKWRAHRKIMHQALNPRAVEQYSSMQESETHKFLLRVLKRPPHFLQEARRLTGSTIMTMAYGYELTEDDPFVPMVEHAVYGLTQTLGVGFIVDTLPILKYVPDWLPGAQFKKLAKEWRRSTRGILELPWAVMMEKYLNGTAIPSYCTRLLDESGGTGCDTNTKLAIKETSAVIYAAGADSTLALISSFILAMTLHPDVQRTAQAELDAVVGRGRLPTLADRPSLPYLECVLRETYRWNPAVPLGVAHRLAQDDVYEGRFIPKGTVVVPNIWAMLHDPDTYASPAAFDPARFTGPTPPKDPRDVVFGFGRRACLGRFFADNAVFTALAGILATLDIRKMVRRDGREITPEVVYPGFVGHPKPFECDIRPRSQETEELVRTAVAREA